MTIRLDGTIDAYPLTPVQQGIFFQTVAAPSEGVYVQQCICELNEALNVSKWVQAWEQLVDRHPILRTGFAWEGTAPPQQIVRESVKLPWHQEDWADSSTEEQASRREAFLQVDSRHGFDLARPPLFRLTLHHLNHSHYQFIWTSHHILVDGRSRLILLEELFETYEALCADRVAVLPPSRPFRLFVEWLDGQDFEKDAPFWRKLLAGYNEPMKLEFGVEREDARVTGIGRQTCRLPLALSARLRSVAGTHGLTLNTLLQVAWAILLGRYHGRKVVIFGATRACRGSDFPNSRETVGLIINTVPVAINLDPNTSVLDLLKQARNLWVTMRPHEHTPLVKIQQWSQLPPGAPLFESLVLFENYELNALLRRKGGPWRRRTFHVRNQSNYPIVVSGYDEPEILLAIEYHAGRFAAVAIERLLLHLQTILARVSDQPHISLSLLSLMTDVDRRQVLEEWNATAVEYPKAKCIHELFEEQVARTPEAVAVVYGGQRVTYAQLDARALVLARHLKFLDVGPEVRVGLCAERSLELVVGVLGILKSGGAYVPLDPNYPPERLRFMLEDTAATLVVTRRELASRLPPKPARMVYLDELDWESRGNLASVPIHVHSDHLAYVIYTSGSTGQPKGVALEHHSVVAFIYWAKQVFSPTELAGVLFSTSICFDLSAFELFVTLSTGGKVIVAQNVLELPSLPAVGEVTLINTVPSGLLGLLNQHAVPPSVQVVNLAGEVLPVALVNRTYALGTVNKVYDLYGPTETTTYSTFSLRQADKPATIGRPIGNTQVYVLDEAGEPVPVGLAGELYIGGVGVARGYLNRTEMTAEKFVPDLFGVVSGRRVYRTGDRCRWLADGTIEFLGRLDQQVKIRGYRVELGEIEAVLLKHSAVADCVVIAMEDVPREKQLVGYVITKEKAACSQKQLQEHLRQILPAYMLPSAFVFLERFPKTPSGKLDREALQHSNQPQQVVEITNVRPRTPDEEGLTRIWKDVLKLKQVGITDNFFDLGGNSILALTLLRRIEQRFGRKLSTFGFLKEPTVAGLARGMSLPSRENHPPSLMIIRSGRAQPPLFCPHIGKRLRYGDLAKHLGPDETFYALEHTGFYDPNDRILSLKEIADSLVKVVLGLQRQGPYLLGGYSLAGIVAYEMAKQLLASGKEVGLLALFDTIAPLSGAYAFGIQLAPLLARFLREHGVADEVVGCCVAAGREDCSDKGLERIYRLAENAGRLDFDWEHFHNYFDSFRQFLAPAETYQTTLDYEGRISLFRSTENLSMGGRCGGWDRFAIASLEAYDVPGDHGSIMEEPQVAALATKLQACLTQARDALRGSKRSHQ